MIQYLSERKNKVLVISVILCLIVLIFPLWYADFGSPDPNYPGSILFYYPHAIGFSFIFHEPKIVESPLLSQYNLRHFPIRIAWRATLEQAFIIALAAILLYRGAKKGISDKRFLLYLSLWTPLVVQYIIFQFSPIDFIYRFTFAITAEQSYPITVRPFMLLVVVIAYAIIAGILFGILLLINKSMKNINQTRAS